MWRTVEMIARGAGCVVRTDDRVERMVEPVSREGGEASMFG